jgi:hypothetical protein
MAKAGIHLSNEILDHIIGYIPDHDDREDRSTSMESGLEGASLYGFGGRAASADEYNPCTANLQTLRSLCLANKNMFTVARRHLYTQFIYGGTEHPDLRQFLLSILEDPYLARQLKFISYEESVICGAACHFSVEEYADLVRVEGKEGPYYVEPECKLVMQKALSFPNLCFDIRDAGWRQNIPFIDHLKRRCPAAQFVLLLCSAPNLEVLTLAVSEADYRDAKHAYPMIERLNSVSSHLPDFSPPLSKLRKLVLESDGELEELWCDLRPWTTIARLPSLRMLHTYGFNMSFESHEGLLAIQNLRLIKTSQSSSAKIYRILQSCQSLKEVKVTHNRWVGTEHTPGFYYHTAHECLQHIQHCKKSLEILDWPHEIHERAMLVGLSSFLKLKVAKVSICSLTNKEDLGGDESDDDEPVPKSESQCDVRSEELVECFPESIEHISFSECYEEPEIFSSKSHQICQQNCSAHADEWALMAFASAAIVRLTKLETVTYCYAYERLEDAWSDRLSSKFAEIGIEFLQEKGYVRSLPPRERRRSYGSELGEVDAASMDGMKEGGLWATRLQGCSE